jgi:hypothetical protein
MTATIDSLAFLVKIDDRRFLVGVDRGRGELEITDVLSFAKHLDYCSADETAVRLRHRGFRQAHVVTILGEPVTSAMLAAAPKAPSKPPLPRTMRDLDAIHARDRNQRYRNDDEFRARVDQIYSKAGR